MLERILELSCRMAETRDLQPLLIYAVDVALELFHAEHGFLVMKNPDGSLNFRVKRQYNGGEIAEPEISRQVLDRVLAEGRPVAAANAMEELDSSPSIYDLNLRSVMCVPLIAHNDVIGALYLDNRIEEGVFGATDLKFVQLFANQAAVSIENAILNEELERRVQMRTAELDAYAHMVAHDLKSPMATILGYADLLEEGWGQLALDDVGEALSFISVSSRKMCNIIDELLLLATIRKQTQIAIKPLDMAQVVAEAQDRLSGLLRDHHAEVIKPDVWPVALGHATWIEEVWVNYISNAAKYGGSPPVLELGATVQPDRQISFWVRDNGAGIPPEKQALLFTEFTRLEEARAQGYGLGLSIVRRIVERLGGQVGFRSESGIGSTFWFALPSAE